MLKTGDKLLCTNGNVYYAAGETYTVGDFIHGNYFELMTGYNGECWYVAKDVEGIYVRFESTEDGYDYSDAWFTEMEIIVMPKI